MQGGNARGGGSPPEHHHSSSSTVLLGTWPDQLNSTACLGGPTMDTDHALPASSALTTTLPSPLPDPTRTHAWRPSQADHNQLAWLPRSLSHLHGSLELLDVQHNDLTALPACLSELTALTALRAGANRLAGLPAGLGACRCRRVQAWGGDTIERLRAGVRRSALQDTAAAGSACIFVCSACVGASNACVRNSLHSPHMHATHACHTWILYLNILCTVFVVGVGVRRLTNPCRLRLEPSPAARRCMCRPCCRIEQARCTRPSRS